MRPPPLKPRRGRRAVIDRRTTETQIRLSLKLDGHGRFANEKGDGSSSQWTEISSDAAAAD